MKSKRTWAIYIRQFGKSEANGFFANEGFENDYDETMKKWSYLKNGGLNLLAKQMSEKQTSWVRLTMELTSWIPEVVIWNDDDSTYEHFDSDTFDNGKKCSFQECDPLDLLVEFDEDYERSWGSRNEE